MQTEAIVTTLLDAARLLREPNSAVARQSVSAAYETAKPYLGNRFDRGSDGAKVLDLATEKPESAFRKAVLIEEANLAGMSTDLVLHSLLAALRGELAGFVRVARPQERVWGSAIRVNTAGRTIVAGERNGGRGAVGCRVLPEIWVIPGTCA